MFGDSFLLYTSNYGYISLGIIMIISFIGIPLPVNTILTFTGVIISENGLNFLITILIVSTGAIVGRTLSFLVGYHVGIGFLKKYGYLFGVSEDKLDKMESWLNKHGKSTLLFGYFLPGIRHTIPYFAGISKMSMKTFIIYASPGAVLWSLVLITLGYVLGEGLEEFLIRFNEKTWAIAVVALIIFAIYLLYKRFIRKYIKRLLRISDIDYELDDNSKMKDKP